ncbi:Zinc finger BED domain-containing protein 4 [Folsomia candida]|uniref:Zinc finger BED domain-containing protein 4 n=1 Tax=Folsomia candida TaxID=158441 RepID=A0A226D8B9_FOLCA|nr:Zinc finger BED domain-containing protein 4 [Folsomia candida]
MASSSNGNSTESENAVSRSSAVLLRQAGVSNAKRSGVWMWFKEDEEDKNKAKCNLCSSPISCGTEDRRSTSSMKRHLDARHKKEFKLAFPKDDVEFEEKEMDVAFTSAAKRPKMTQQTIEESLQATKLWDIMDPRAVKIHYAIGEMIAVDVLPFNIMDKIGFNNFSSIIQPRYKVPGRTFMNTKIVPDIYARSRQKIQEAVDQEPWISFTTDIWTSSCNNFSFISFTAHLNSESFSNHHVVLNCKYFPGSHTGSTIEGILNEILSEWNIEKSRVHLLVADSAANIVKGINNADLALVPCFSHKIQLAYQDSIRAQKTVNDLISRAKNIVSKFNQSPKNCELLKDKQNEAGLIPKKLLQDIATRWNSTFYMLERMNELKQFIGALSTEIKFANLRRGASPPAPLRS